MTTRRQQQLPYIRALADRLHLRDWRFEVREDLPANTTVASIACIEGRKFAVVRLGEDYFADSPEERRRSIAHELIHCHLAACWHAVEKRTNDDPVLLMLMEYTVDGLADAIGPLLPLPPEIEDR